MAQGQEQSGRTGITILVLAHVLLSLAFALAIPLWEAPDEPAHFLRLRAEARRMGLLSGRETSRWLFPPGGEKPPGHPGLELQRGGGFWKKGTVVSGYERHQPPGYYLLAAPLLAFTGGGGQAPFFFNHQYESRIGPVFFHGADRDPPYSGVRRSVLALRLLSTLFGAVTVVLVWRIALALFPAGSGRGRLALLAAALTAFLPQFVFITSVINNDALAMALSAAFLLALVRPGSGRLVSFRRGLLLALILAAGLLTEFALLFLLPAALAWFSAAGAKRSRLTMAAALSTAFLLPLSLLALPARFIPASAHWDPLRQLDRFAMMGHGLLEWGSLREMARLFFTSAWATFGWMSVQPPLPLIAAFATVSLLMTWGLVRLFSPAPRKAPRSTPAMAAGTPLLFAAALACLAFMVLKNALFTFQPQGRMLFPLLPLAAPLAAAGLQRLTPGRRLIGPAVALFMIGATFYGLLGMIRPFYAARRAPIRFTLPHESAILYGLYGAGFTVDEHAGQSTRAGLQRTGALRLCNPNGRPLAAALRFTAEPTGEPTTLEIWDRRERIGRIELAPGGQRFHRLERRELPPGETVIFFHLPDGDRGVSCRVSGLALEPSAR